MRRIFALSFYSGCAPQQTRYPRDKDATKTWQRRGKDAKYKWKMEDLCKS